MQASAEYQLATLTTGSNVFTVNTSNWFSEAILPAWPGGVQPSFWAITQINLKMQKTSTASGTYFVRVYAADSSGKPTGAISLPLATAAINLADVPTTLGWLANPITLSATGLNAAKKYCVVVGCSSALIGTVSVGVDAASADTSFDYSTSTTSGSSWVLNTARDLIFDLTGYYETGAAAPDTTSSPVAVDGLTNPTLTLDVNSKSNRQLTVLLMLRNLAGTPDPNDAVCTAMTFDGVGVSLVADSGWGPGWERVLAYSLVNPDAGTGLTLSATLTGTYWAGEMFAVCSVNVNQVSPVGMDYQTRAGTDNLLSGDPTPSAGVPAQAGDLILDGLAWSGAATVSALGSPRDTLVNTNNSAAGDIARGSPTGGTVYVAWLPNSAATFAYLALAVRGLDNPDPEPSADYSQHPKFLLRPPDTSDFHDFPDDGPSA